ncbi:protein Red [Nephila pilipes]|uniref:Protein Red n=1 Tax=Nephila pilipes TaxID=299642 RepID=A0A8X6TFD0_NEPPI|nr:protein Red [Nephila pilipes]
MACIICLENKYAYSDIPTNLLRNKAYYPSFESQTPLTTNDIVIKKLTQVLSYFQQDLHNKMAKKKDRGKLKEEETKSPKLDDNSLFVDIGDYVPWKRETKQKYKNADPEKRES